MANINTIETESIQVGLAAAPPIAAVDIWPSLNPQTPFSQQVNGINNFLALTNQIGLHNGIGMLNQIGLDNVLGFHTKVGGEVDAEPDIEMAAPSFTLSSPSGTLDGTWRYNGSIICAPCPSDEKSKVNVKPLENPLDKVLSLQGVSFNWNSEVVPQKAAVQNSSIGLIAQEVEKVVPEVVVNQIIENQDLKTVEYGNLTALLIEAIKEQQEQINSLKETVQELSTKLAECCS
jgi:hypothetical protein